MKGFDGDTIHAMIVEDEPKIGMYIKDKIEALDVTIRVEAVAENGKEALQKKKKKQPQVVFTDISMPVMDGLELAKIVKSTYPGILVVIISGYSDDGETRRTDQMLPPYYEKLGYQKGLCPHAEKLYSEIMSLPLYYSLTDQDVADVIAAVRKLCEYYKKK